MTLASRQCIFNNVRKEGLDSYKCLMTDSTLHFNCRDCAKNRAGLGGGIGNWSGTKADERKAWSDWGFGIP